MFCYIYAAHGSHSKMIVGVPTFIVLRFSLLLTLFMDFSKLGLKSSVSQEAR